MIKTKEEYDKKIKIDSRPHYPEEPLNSLLIARAISKLLSV